MGYRNAFIKLEFPDLAEDGDYIDVLIRNPRLMPAGELRALAGKQGPADAQRLAAARQITEAGGEVPDDLVTEEDADRGFAFAAKLVADWHVYDATVENGELLPLPATAESIAKLPQDILLGIMAEVGKANPTRSPGDGTGKTS
jgi:hypothetical protein